MKTIVMVNDEELTLEEYAVYLAKSMLLRELSFMEGAVKMSPLRNFIEGVSEYDEDFLAFTAISSETDHLPLVEQRHLWNPAALKK